MALCASELSGIVCHMYITPGSSGIALNPRSVSQLTSSSMKSNPLSGFPYSPFHIRLIG